MKHILCVGELLVDLTPTKPIRLAEPCYTPHAGGAVANVAVAIARLGGSVRFVGAFSADQFGQLLVQTLADNHIDIRYMQPVNNAPTTVALVTLSPGGQRHFSFFRQQTADTQLRAENLNWEAWHAAAICHVGGVLLSSEPGRSATLAAIEHTRHLGSLVSCDINLRPTLWDSFSTMHHTITKLVEQIDILKLSREEAELLNSGEECLTSDPLDLNELKSFGRTLLEQGPSLVIITLGADGTLLQTKQHQVAVPASPVPAVDTTGAGDAFMGTILYQLVQQGLSTPTDLLALSEHDLSKLGSLANLVAGLSCTRYGVISSLPYIDEVRSALDAQAKAPTPQE